MKTNGFIKNTKLLEETPRVPDSMEWDNIKNLIEIKIKSIKKSSIIAIVGPYGIGKSTMIDKIELDLKSTKNFWFNFEAWKYPERENLWENFIYDFTKASKAINESEVRDLINGELHGWKLFIKNLITTLSAMAHVDYVGVLFSSYLKDYPVKRVCEFQKLLDKIIKKINKPIYITVEDIDRSGDKGLFFLETLKNYLENKTSSKKITILVPISSSHYEEDIDRYLKVVDHFEFFNPPYTNFLKFVDDYIRDDLKNTNDHLLVAEFFSQYFHQNPDMTLRRLKLILRQANIVYENQVKDGHKPDWRLTLAAEIMKFTPNTEGENLSYYDSVSIHKGFSSNSIFGAYVEAIRTNQNSLLDSEKELLEPYCDIITISKNPNDKDENYVSIPWIGQRGYPRTGSNAIFIEDFYFRYN